MKSLRQLLILTKRITKQNLTSADTLVTVVAMPIFMLLFFVYVLGGSILTTTGQAPNLHSYLNYALPGFLLITMTMGSAYTALRINTDQISGFLSRLHSMPIKRWVILGSHVLASVIFMLLAELAVALVGLLIGYRTNASWSQILSFIGLSILFGLAITLLAIPFSLRAKNYASAGGFSYIIIMLMFVSSAFMPTKGMATPVRIFADHQPMTPIVNTARGLLQTNFALSTTTIVQAFSWLAALIIIFAGLSYSTYQQIYVKR